VVKLAASESGRAPWIAILAVVALTLGLGVALWKSRTPRAATPPPAAAPAADAAISDTTSALPPDAIDQALALAGDSTAIKTGWKDNVPGLDLMALAPAQRELFLRFANARRCTCGCGYTLAGCRAYDAECETSGPLVQALYDSAHAGLLHATKGLRTRPRG
jgi:hypothetical protein